MFWFKKKEKYTDNEIDLIVVGEISKVEEENDPYVLYEICLHNKKTVIGRCDLRLSMNEEMYYMGQIGYTIASKYRGNHYASKACKILFKIAHQKYGLNQLIVTCNPDNLASYKTLLALGGVLKETVEVPFNHPLRQQGDTHKCIFVYQLN